MKTLLFVIAVLLCTIAPGSASATPQDGVPVSEIGEQFRGHWCYQHDPQPQRGQTTYEPVQNAGRDCLSGGLVIGKKGMVFSYQDGVVNCTTTKIEYIGYTKDSPYLVRFRCVTKFDEVKPKINNPEYLLIREEKKLKLQGVDYTP